MTQAHVAQPSSEPLTVYRTKDREGAVYYLELDTRRWLTEHAGAEVRLPDRVFIAHASRDDYKRVHPGLRRLLVPLLTGLSEERLEALGAAGVQIWDPEDEVLVPVTE
jgi:hypothetical protein